MMIKINPQTHPTVDIPQWDPPYGDQTDTIVISPQTQAYLAALHRYLPSSSSSSTTESDSAFNSDDSFRMYEFKVRRCPRVRSHDWTDCPFAHPGEKARRRDPRRRHYSAVPCPEFRRGSCWKGDSCEFAHGVFESWLHPTRYRTQPCNDGRHCRRRVCFFAHSHGELRVVAESPPSYDGGDSVAELVGAMRGLKIEVMRRAQNRGLRLASCLGYPSRSGLRRVDPWEVSVERVESGRDLTAGMYAKLSRENSLDWGRVDSANMGPDFGWVFELVN